MKRSSGRYLAALLLLLLNGAAMAVFHRYPALFFPAYRNVSKAWIGLLAQLSSFTSIAVWDIAAVLLVLLLAELGYEIRLYTQEELQEACEYYLLKAAEYAPDMQRDTEGHLVPHEFDALAKKAGSAYAALGEEYAVLQGTDLPVKKLSLIGEYLMYNGIIGMFMPLTGEAGVPASVPPAVMPFTMALYHSHDEDSGVQLVQLDRFDTAAIYQKYESSLQDVSDKINDTYLKTFSQESGIQSYGEVTNDLIAWYLEERN